LPSAQLRLQKTIESNHDCNPDYICLKTSSEQKQNPFAWFDVSTVYFQTTYDMNQRNK